MRVLAYSKILSSPKAGSTLVTLLHNITPDRDSVEGTRDRVTNQKLVMRTRDQVTQGQASPTTQITYHTNLIHQQHKSHTYSATSSTT